MALSVGAVAALLGYFRRFENSARYLGWAGPAGTVPVGLVASSSGFSMLPGLAR